MHLSAKAAASAQLFLSFLPKSKRQVRVCAGLWLQANRKCRGKAVASFTSLRGFVKQRREKRNAEDSNPMQSILSAACLVSLVNSRNRLHAQSKDAHMDELRQGCAKDFLGRSVMLSAPFDCGRHLCNPFGLACRPASAQGAFVLNLFASLGR